MPLSQREVRRLGALDGRGWRWAPWPFRKEGHGIPFPAKDQQGLCEAENTIVEEASAELRSITGQWVQRDHAHREACQVACEEYRVALENEAVQKADVAMLNKKALGPEPAWTQTLKELTPPHIAPWLGMVIVGAISLSEILLNYTVFQVFNLSLFETLFASAGVLIAFIVLPHHVGSRSRSRKTKGDWVGILISIATSAAGLYYLSILRGNYLKIQGIGTSNGLEAWATQGMLAFNLVMTVAVAIVARESTMDRRQREIESSMRDRTKERNQGEQEVTEASRTVAQKLSALEGAHRARMATFGSTRERARIVIDRGQNLIGVYRLENRKHRDREHPAPATWENSPQSLREVEEILRNDSSEPARILLGEAATPSDCEDCPYWEWRQDRLGRSAGGALLTIPGERSSAVPGDGAAEGQSQ